VSCPFRQGVRSDALKERRLPDKCAKAAVEADLLARLQEISSEDLLVANRGSPRVIEIEEALIYGLRDDADDLGRPPIITG
jgi:hypothetical protein